MCKNFPNWKQIRFLSTTFDIQRRWQRANLLIFFCIQIILFARRNDKTDTLWSWIWSFKKNSGWLPHPISEAKNTLKCWQRLQQIKFQNNFSFVYFVMDFSHILDSFSLSLFFLCARVFELLLAYFDLSTFWDALRVFVAQTHQYEPVLQKDNIKSLKDDRWWTFPHLRWDDREWKWLRW